MPFRSTYDIIPDTGGYTPPEEYESNFVGNGNSADSYNAAALTEAPSAVDQDKVAFYERLKDSIGLGHSMDSFLASGVVSPTNQEIINNIINKDKPVNSADTSGSKVPELAADSSLDTVTESSDLSDWINQFERYVNQQYAFNQASADRAMAFEADQARINREWQEMMSNTSYQRAVADMKAAGINPLLAFSSMSGASTPSGSAASGTSASGSLGNFSSFYSSLMSSFNNNKTVAANFIGSIVKIIGLLMMFA